MSLAERTRTAAREHPFLVAALRADVCNYAAAARFLDVDGDEEAVATALRRFAEDLPAYDRTARSARVEMVSGVGTVGPGDEGRGGEGPDTVVAVGPAAVAPGAGTETALLATGAVDARALAAALDRLAVAGVDVTAAGVAGDAMVVVVGRRDGAAALRHVEAALEAVPDGRDTDEARRGSTV